MKIFVILIFIYLELLPLLLDNINANVFFKANNIKLLFTTAISIFTKFLINVDLFLT